MLQNKVTLSKNDLANWFFSVMKQSDVSKSVANVFEKRT